MFNSFNKKTIGASTITMQIARMIERRERNLSNKIIEIFRALQLEFNFSKEELLEIYFNIAPYGGNIEGIKSASLLYFDKNLRFLTPFEISLLTLIPKNPNIYRLDKNSDIKEKAERVLKLMLENSIISKESFKRAIENKIEFKRFKAIARERHFCNLEIFKKSNQKLIKTSIDSNLQQFTKKTLQKHLIKLKDKNINSGAILVIDNLNMSIKSYIGSENFDSQNGQNDGVLALNSVGSTLKPFTYALALDNGLITPLKKVLDIPLNFSGYVVKNFDKYYRGLITSEEALKLSLNTPFVDLHFKLKDKSLYELLKNLNFIDREKKYYGASLALGGFDFNLLKLTYLYTSFANEGYLKPLKVSKNLKLFDIDKKLFSKEASFITSDILSKSYMPKFSSYYSSTENPTIAFKTGTSANHRDILTIGFNREYTVGIWLGNFDNSKADNEATGLNSASPLLFDIYNYFDNSKLTFLQKTKTLKEKEICQDPFISIDSKNCIEKVLDFKIDNISYKNSCENLTPEKLSFLLKDANYLKSLSFCFDDLQNRKPIITMPYNNSKIIKSKLIPLEYQKINLICHSYQIDNRIYWFLNGEFWQESESAKESFIDLKEGKYEIGCLDSFSNFSTINIEVKY